MNWKNMAATMKVVSALASMSARNFSTGFSQLTCAIYKPFNRTFSTSSSSWIKKVEVTKDEGKTVIEGKKVEPQQKSPVRKINAPTGCPLCEFQDSLTYRDVLILRQFLSPDGRILPMHVTGMCFTMQWKLERLLYQSYSAGLLPNYKPKLPIAEDAKTYEKNYKWRKNNVYFEDFGLHSAL